MSEKLYKEALKLSALGLKVHPLKPNSKAPASRNGYKDASQKPEQLATWFMGTDSNIGVRTGNGLLVIDFDPRNGGLESYEEIKEYLPETLRVNTSNGGFHLYFKSDEFIKSGANVLGQGVVVRAEESYVVAPPSILPSGEQYSFANWGMRIAVLPDEVLVKLLFSKPKKDFKSKLKDGIIPMGERNNSLLSYEGYLRRKGHNEEFIFTALEQLNTEARTKPLSSEETENIFGVVTSLGTVAIVLGFFLMFFDATGTFGAGLLFIGVIVFAIGRNIDKHSEEKEVRQTLEAHQQTLKSKTENLRIAENLSLCNTYVGSNGAIILDEMKKSLVFITIKKEHKVLFSEIINVEFTEQTNMKNDKFSTDKLGAGALGGLMFGGAGAVVGALSVNDLPPKAEVTAFNFKILIDNVNMPMLKVNLLTEPVPISSSKYQTAYEEMETLHAKLMLLISKSKNST